MIIPKPFVAGELQRHLTELLAHPSRQGKQDL
jgi:hypothetical protein